MSMAGQIETVKNTTGFLFDRTASSPTDAGSSRSSRNTVMSMSAENRRIRSHAFDRDVPPLKQEARPSGGSLAIESVQGPAAPDVFFNVADRCAETVGGLEE